MANKIRLIGNKCLRFIHRFIVNILGTVVGVVKSFSIAMDESYYPSEKRKCHFRRVIDNWIWAIKEHEANENYTKYGLDLLGSDSSEYLGYYNFTKQRDYMNGMDSPDSQLAILRDKFLFYSFLDYYKFNTPEVFAIIYKGQVFNRDFDFVGETFLANCCDYFIKAINGQCASFVKNVHEYNDFLLIKKSLNDTYIVQKKLDQHEALNKLNPCAINTIRIVTVNKNGKINVLYSILRIGTSKTGKVDNTSVGGIACGINEDGRLQQYGFMKPMYGGRIDRHPDSNIAFEGFVIPYYQEALKMVCEAHKRLFGIFSIGWDIAITPKGPAFIEGNDNWEIGSIQAIYGGIKEQWDSLLKS